MSNEDQAECLLAVAEQAAREIAAGVVSCILCGCRADVLGAFVPERQFANQIGVPVNKTRTILYAICDQCVALPDAERCDAIEALLLARGPAPWVLSPPGAKRPVYLHETN